MKNNFFKCILSLLLLISTSLNAQVKPDIDKIDDAVVVVLIYDYFGNFVGHGSGFLIDNKGTVATNFHVVKEAFSLKVRVDNNGIKKDYDVQNILKGNETKDLAIISINNTDQSTFSFLNLSKSLPSKGDDCWAIGSPADLKYMNTVSNGLISNIDLSSNPKTLQTNAEISHGSSGGALVNSKGEVIGVTSSGDGSDDGARASINFAVCISELNDLESINKKSIIDQNAIPCQLSFFTNSFYPKFAYLYVDEVFLGSFSKSFESNITPKCGDEGTLTRYLYSGKHNYQVYYVESGSWAFGTVDLQPGQCQIFNITDNKSQPISGNSIIESCKKLIMYERYNSAITCLKKIIENDPNNEEAIYWLGQAMIRPEEITSKDLAEAKALYQSKLSVSNSQLLMAGIGHVELLEGKTQDARNHFEAAISLSQGKSIAVLNAIGFANGNPDSKNGDAQYAIGKLKQATLIKKFNDPEVLVNLGDAYRKNDDGGNAIQAYQSALVINPKYARAYYRIGKLYQSQGKGQESIFMEYFNNAIAVDPLFAPVYSNLFNYYYESNVTRAADYFEKWLATSDEDYKSCYYRAALKYAQGYFLDAIAKADECIATGGTNPYPNLFGLKANAYNRLKDSVNAIQNYAEYFKRQSSDKITSGDYIEYAKNLLKIPGNEAQAGLFVDKALALDSIESNKVQYVKSIAQAYESKKNFKDAADWYRRILNIKKNPGKVDLYNTGYNYYKGSVYDSAISIFSAYSQKFPDDIFGFFMTGKTSWIIDSTLQLGLANVAFEKTIQIGMADTVKYKSQLITCYRYFASYDANIKKDKASAVSYLDKILSLDPADAEANANKAILTAAPKAAAQKPKVAPQKP